MFISIDKPAYCLFFNLSDINHHFSRLATVSFFGAKQDDATYQNQGVVDAADDRYKEFYTSVTNNIGLTLPYTARIEKLNDLLAITPN